MIKLLLFNIQARLIEWLDKPKEISLSGYDWIEWLGKL